MTNKKQAMLYKKIGNNKVECFLCGHRCKINEGKYGICNVRQNIKGDLYTLTYGKAIAANIDSIEKKPLYHFLPGSISYSIATMGCNFKCSFCQNWRISQFTSKGKTELPGQKLSPENIVKSAKEKNCESISYTYTEPTIFFEYAYDTAKLAKSEGLYNVFVTNGFMTNEAIKTLEPFLDAANIDLKSFRNEFYRKMCKARLEPVLESIKYMKKLGIWVEITTLVVPEQNDSDKELNNIAEFIAGVDKNIPWHISRFHPDYEYTNSYPTPMKTLEKARKIGKENGLNFVYLGNVSSESNTYCNNCGELLVERSLFGETRVKIKNNRCPSCKLKIPGIWKKN